MALEHHHNHRKRFEQQVDNSLHYVIPFIEKTCALKASLRVLEIGCGEGGVLKPFIDKGCEVVGVDLDVMRIELANEFLADEIKQKQAKFCIQNVYDEDFLRQYLGYFDLIILKDVIEHIPNQENFIPYLKKLLRPAGQVYFGFPPWYMPFGGHQQVATGKWTSKLPYYHILPMWLYKWILRQAKEKPNIIQDLVEVKETGITIERFEKIVQQSGFSIVQKQLFLINPIYQFKFGLKPRKQLPLLGALPFIRNFITTCAYYTIEKL